jgi:hypothetical protein
MEEMGDGRRAAIELATWSCNMIFKSSGFFAVSALDPPVAVKYAGSSFPLTLNHSENAKENIERGCGVFVVMVVYVP